MRYLEGRSSGRGAEGRARRRRGSIAVALLFTALLTVVGFAVASLASTQLQLTSRARATQSARHLAESVISQAIGRIMDTPDFGKRPAPASNQLVARFAGGNEGEEGVLSFDASAAAALGIPHSTNNLGADTPSSGWNGTVVPADAVHLVGVGRSAGVTRRVEAVIYVPRFPYLVASSGPLSSTGGLYVAGVSDAQYLDNDVTRIPPEHLRPGHVASNASSGAGGMGALELTGNGNRVSGDLQAVGSIILGEGTTVGGEVRPFADSVALPRIPVTSYDTAGKPGLITLTGPSTYDGTLSIDSYARRDGGYTVTGGIRLNGGVLYVDGDLDVSGGISGRGAVIVNGRTTVQGGGLSATSSLAALVSKGDLTIQGTPGQTAGFQGLVYTEGDFTAAYVNLAGVLVANKQDPGGSRVSMTSSALLQLSQASSISVTVGTGTAPAPSPPALSGNVVSPFYGSRNGVRTTGIVTVQYDLSLIPYNAQTGRYEPDLSNPMRYLRFTGDRPPGFVQYNSASAFQQFLAGQGFTRADQRTYSQLIYGPDSWPNSWHSPQNMPYLQNLLTSFANQQQSSPSPSPTPSPGPGGGDTWSLDLNQFINVAEKLRVLVWRDL